PVPLVYALALHTPLQGDTRASDPLEQPPLLASMSGWPIHSPHSHGKPIPAYPALVPSWVPLRQPSSHKPLLRSPVRESSSRSTPDCSTPQYCSAQSAAPVDKPSPLASHSHPSFAPFPVTHRSRHSSDPVSAPFDIR